MRGHHVLSLLLLAGLLAGSAHLVQIERVYESLGTFSRPVDLQTAPGDANRVFVVEKSGIITVFDPAGGGKQTFLDITSQVTSGSSEQGLLGLAFHPAYQANGYFFVYFSTSSGASTVVSRFQRTSATQADPGSELRYLTISQPFSNHNGGQLQFGPDNFLYIAVGDGGSANDPQDSGQDTDTLRGNLLRIDVDQASSPNVPYSVPASNPFAQGGGAAEIYAFGLRNPWRFSFDSETGLIWIADVGQGAFEEINVASAPGQNFGWKPMEGCGCRPPATSCDMDFTMPVHAYPRNVGRSVTGGYVYHGDGLGAALKAHYFFADYVLGTVFAIDTTAVQGSCGTDALVVAETNLNIGTFGLIHDQVLLADYNSGILYKISPDPVATMTASSTTTMTTSPTATMTASPTATMTASSTAAMTASPTAAMTVSSPPSSTTPTNSPGPSGTPAPTGSPAASQSPQASVSPTGSPAALSEDPVAPLPPQQLANRREAITVQDNTRNIMIEWQVDGQFVHFRVAATATGYVAMGFSTDGSMNSGRTGSDIVMGYIDSGTGQSKVNDYWSLSYGQPELDEQQNLQHVSVSRSAGVLTLAFTRPLQTIDSFEDRKLLADGQSLFLIWAMSDEEPRDIDAFAFHIARGDFFIDNLRNPDGAVVSTSASASPNPSTAAVSTSTSASLNPSPAASPSAAPPASRAGTPSGGQVSEPSGPDALPRTGSSSSEDSTLDSLSSGSNGDDNSAVQLSGFALAVVLVLFAIYF